MRVLVTGARAPASMDIIRTLIREGHEVFSADSMNFPLGRFVTGIQKHLTFPKPNRDLDAFLKTLKSLLIEYQIDWLIPTCEEIFFISQGHEELSKHTQLFCEPFHRLNPLHNKYEFNQLALQYGLNAPESWLLRTEEDKRHIPANTDIVLKPIFSRFGEHVILKPSQKVIDELVLDVPYLAQRFITGKEYCAYAIAHEGKVLIHSCYHPKYTAGPAAGIYFEPADPESIKQFMQIFCKQYQFSGQIAFDFILDENRAFVLECNPRTTSGFHLVAPYLNWLHIWDRKKQNYQVTEQAVMLGLGMMMHGLPYLRKNPKRFIADYRAAKDILNDPAYPWLELKSMLTLFNIVFRMVKERKSFHGASTDDIEFNGHL
ncbi:ATP-grasp domain-containing protein [Legionella longbeachae]|uniref:ATP-grasp domain-containing protein n=1 Tax=Legionella longbeachae TaxID=450 RepID=UPI0012465C70|nr:ATP-grasp domain-containing protein [Legionella longbeachae]QEY50877.1 ATP-grasp domain-containing protein [Legionella longbeachae]